MHVVTVGDVVLDVLVETGSPLRPDDDTDARIQLSVGGQAANVAAWAVRLGARATVVGPRDDSAASAVLSAGLAAYQVSWSAVPTVRAGSVVAWVSPAARTLASDPGDVTWTDRLDPGSVPPEADHLHLSGYPLLRAHDPVRLLAYVAAVQQAGASLSVDLSSAALVASYGEDRLADLMRDLSPSLVFGTAPEVSAAGQALDGLEADVVVKHGPVGVTTRSDGVVREYPAAEVAGDGRDGGVVDSTGAGDALAAGYLVGGIELGLSAAARCVGTRGAMPPASPL